MPPEARIAITVFVCTYLISRTLVGREATRAKLMVAGTLAPILGFALVGCWQTWSVLAAAGAGLLQIVTSLIWPAAGGESVARWIIHRVLTCLAIVGVVLVAFFALETNPYTWIDAAGAVPYFTLVLATGAVFTVAGGADFMATAIKPFSEQLKQRSARAESPKRIALPDGFIAGGRTIGQYERLLVFIFTLFSTPTAIGFLIAAKSIFRFGDVTDSENRQKAEYILLGTLMSFTFAVITSLVTRTILDWY